MPDTFTKSTTTGYGNRIINSVKGLFFGLLLVLMAFGVLYWNEGRTDSSLLARQSKIVSAVSVTNDASFQNQLVSVTGTLTSEGKTGDGLFLKPGPYVSITREVEMYAWDQAQNTAAHSNVNGSQNQNTTYTYDKVWTEFPKDSTLFAEPASHVNPIKLLNNVVVRAHTINVGAYALADTQSVQLPAGTLLTLNSANVDVSGGDNLTNGQGNITFSNQNLAGQNYVFMPSASSTGTISAPQVGDIRISYVALNPGEEVTLMGKLNGSSISAYVDGKGNTMYRVFNGTRGQAIAGLHSEYQNLTWILRLVGFLLMFFGLLLVTSPISEMLDIIPIVGGLSTLVLTFIAFLLAVIFALVTMAISILFHNILALAFAVVIVLIAAGLVLFKKKVQA